MLRCMKIKEAVDSLTWLLNNVPMKEEEIDTIMYSINQKIEYYKLWGRYIEVVKNCCEETIKNKENK